MPTAKIVGHGMDRREQEKFDRIADTLQTTFTEAGFRDVSDCKAITIEKLRQLYFFRHTENLPLVILTEEDFMSGTADELSAMIVLRLREAKHNHSAEPKKKRQAHSHDE